MKYLLTHAIAWVLKREKIHAARRITFGTGVAVLFVILFPASRSWASAALSNCGLNRGVVPASSIPQGVCGSNHSHGCLVVSSADSLPNGRRQANKKHCKKEVIVWADTVGKVLLEFPHEDAGLEALHLGSRSNPNRTAI
jgi:hypothetical protein